MRISDWSSDVCSSDLKAAEAYNRGFTGKDVTVAVIDSGIDVNGSEFAGRLSDKSKSFESQYAPCMTCAPESITFDLDDVQGHGTKVSSIAAGAKDGKGIHGIAYDATILALKIAAPDLNTPGTPINEGGLNAAARSEEHTSERKSVVEGKVCT